LAAAADAGRAPLDPRSGLTMATGADVAAVRAVQAARSEMPVGLERDPATGLLLGEGDRALLDAAQAARVASVPTDPRAQSAALRGLDLAGREGVLSARFQTWGMPMDPLAQEEMRIRHAFQQEMIRCNSLQAGANVMASIFAGPTNGLSWSLGQLGAGMTAEMCRMRAQQNAEAEMIRLRQIAHQREMARQQQMMGARPGAWGPVPQQAWSQGGQDGGMKTPEPRRRPAQR
jgi:hypothetical protein